MRANSPPEKPPSPVPLSYLKNQRNRKNQALEHGVMQAGSPGSSGSLPFKNQGNQTCAASWVLVLLVRGATAPNKNKRFGCFGSSIHIHAII